jgi:exopolyphosphatase/guanosine-5'-triphosphate,3'-diphosphate pyrophosphatase
VTSGNADSGTIVPRWEWRTFVEPFGSAPDVLATVPADRVHESDEIYLLSAHSDASVKVRDELMDVKQLEQVNEDGLELWIPTMKATFPLSPADVAAVFTALDVAVPTLERDDYPLAALEAELIQPNPDLRSLHVHKRRHRYVVDECMVELSELSTDRSSLHTLAIESPDPHLVLAMVHRFGLDQRRNVSVSRALKAGAGLGGRRHAVIDVGTNSVKFHLAEQEADGGLRTIIDRADITRLGEGLAESGQLDPEAMKRTVEAIAAMVDTARSSGALSIAAVGTAGVRLAPNREVLIDAIRARTGITLEVISGEEEARLAYLAARSTLGVVRGRLVVFDSGGGSTQFTFGRGEQVEERFSVDVGAVRIAERYALAEPVSEQGLAEALASVAGDLSRLDGQAHPDAIIAIGGTATNLAAVKHGLATYDPEVVHGTVLDLAEIDRQIELYRTRDADERRQIVGLQPARAEVILAGACIVRTILTKLGHESLTVSDRGLRHGLFVERFAT